MTVGASGFGQCEACGCSVERVGWDDLCFSCQESEKAEMADDWEERQEEMAEEDRRLYTVPLHAADEPSDGRDLRGGLLP